MLHDAAINNKHWFIFQAPTSSLKLTKQIKCIADSCIPIRDNLTMQNYLKVPRHSRVHPPKAQVDVTNEIPNGTTERNREGKMEKVRKEKSYVGTVFV